MGFFDSQSAAVYGKLITQPPALLLKALLNSDCTGNVPLENVTFADAP